MNYKYNAGVRPLGLILFIFLLLMFPGFSYAQKQRLSDNNSIGWFVYTGTFKIKPKLALHTEYQWRRVNGIKDWQQGLFRVGINYAVRKDINLNAGYAFAETFPYGDYPGVSSFPEHRVFEQVLLKHNAGITGLSHRFTLEQRFVGKVDIENSRKKVSWNYMNRVRYRFRAEIPLMEKRSLNNKWRLILQDELFVGFGKNVAENIFDQNRMACLIGYSLNKNTRFEVGYINQFLQQAKRVGDKLVFQYNNGFTIAMHLQL